jgi:glutathione peroxidase
MGGSIYDFTLKTIDGKQQPLSVFKGQVILMVNVASQCGYTPQYEGLEKLYET